MFNKDLYYKKYLKYKNKYINLQSQIGGARKKVNSVPVSTVGPLIVSPSLDKKNDTVVKTRRREFKPPLDVQSNPTAKPSKHVKPSVLKKSNDVPRLLPYIE